VERDEADPWLRSDGRTDWVRWEIRPWHTGEGVIGGLMGFSENITERVVAEAALRASEERFGNAFRSSPAAIAISRIRDGLFLEVNEACCRLFDYPRAEMVGRTSVELGISDLESRRQVMNDLTARGIVHQGEVAVPTRTGARRHVLFSIALIDVRGEPCALTTFIDVTERMLAESRVERQVGHLSALRAVDAAVSAGYDLQATLDLLLTTARAELQVDAAAVFLMDPATETLVCAAGQGFRTPGWAGLRLPRGEGFAGKAAVERRIISVPNLAASELPAASVALVAGEGFLGIHAVPLIVEGRVTGVMDVFHRTPLSPSPEWLAFLDALAGQAAMAIDRARLSEGLQTAREHEQQAATAGRVGLWDWDLRSNRVYYSPEWKRQIGYAPGEIADDFMEWQSRIHPDDQERSLAAMQAYLANPVSPFGNEFRFRHRDGSYRHILAHGSLVRDETGHPIRMLGSHVDVTELTELQGQFLQAQKMESVGRLAGGIAHDFNNLLTAINATADLAILGLRDDDPLRADLEEIRRAGDRAAALTRQLLAFSRKQVLQPAVLCLTTLVADLERMLRRLIGEDVTLEIVSAPDLGQVKADPGQLEQALVNLVVNARDAMPDGGTLRIATRNVELDDAYARQHPDVAPGSYVELSVGDTGVGMDGATLERIFEPFFTTKDAGKGTGLGLSTVFGIVKQSGGSIGVTSEIGHGTRFTIHLPRVQDSAPRDRHLRPTTDGGGTETILVVEDEEGLRRVAVRALTSAGYKVLVAANGGDALQTLEQTAGPVHLLVTDIVMPGMSGRELADRLRDTRPDMRVLFSSGYTEDVILRHGVLDEHLHFLAKPYSISDLRAKVRQVLDL
jgi:PAS domain S-box-containing protein